MQLKIANSVVVNNKSRVSVGAVASQGSTCLMQSMKYLKQLVQYAFRLYYDKYSAICLHENIVLHGSTKLVESHYQFIQEKVCQGEISLEHIKIEHKIQTWSPKVLLFSSWRISARI